MRNPVARALAALTLLALLVLPGQVGAQRPGVAPMAWNPPTFALPGDWPMYGHDVSRTNYNPDETTISAVNVAQLTQSWQVNIQTNGTPPSGAPSVADGVVYVGSSITSTAQIPNFFALSAVTGATIWSKDIGYRRSCFNVGIGSTPAISGTVVVVGADNASSDPSYYGLDTSNLGAQLWVNPMGVGISGFPWASPLNYNGRTYVGMASRCDNPSVRGEVRALNLTTGVQQANQYIVNSNQVGGGIWNSPALSPDGSTLAVGTGEDFSGCTAGNPCPYVRAMVTLDPTTLAILQAHQEPSPNQDADYGTTPVIFHDNQNRVLVGANHKNGTFYAYVLNNVNAGALWTRATGTSVGMMPAYDPNVGSGGTLFIYGSGGQLYAVDPATGTNRWTPVTASGAHGNMALANGLIFINRGASGLEIRSETDGTLIRTLPPQNAGATNSGVAVSNGFVYWLSGSYINAWSLPVQGTPTVTASPGTPSSTPTRTNTPSITPTSGVISATPTRTPTPLLTNTPGVGTSTPPPTITPGGPTSTPPPTVTPGGPTSTATVAVTPTSCPVQFVDVPASNTFYTYVRCLACRGIVGGYPCGGPGEPCPGPYYRPNANVTRGQTAKIVSESAGFADVIPSTQQTFEDVPPGSTFALWVERLSVRGIIGGYPCGGPFEPCVAPTNRPYFRPNNNVTRGQLSKITSGAAGWTETPTGQTFEDVAPGSTFYVTIERMAARGIISGYPCGNPGEPCIAPGNRPYFRPNNNATRGQMAKIAAAAFFPNCQTPTRR